MSLKSGMELMIKGVPKPDPVRFTINVGQSGQVIGLHFDFRFNYFGEWRTIVMNSLENGCWGEEQREHNFPFEAGREFEIFLSFYSFNDKPLDITMTISLTEANFFITLPDGNIIKFPNRLGDKHYDHITMEGDVMVHLICAN